MSEKIGSRFTTQDRTRLQEMIPLDTPFLLFIDPSSACNFKCVFCPCGGANKDQWAGHKKPGILSYELYRTIIDSAAQFPHKIKTLRLYKEGEPLLNKRLPDMIRYARKRQVAERIDFTTNGSLFNRDLNLALMDAGVDRINISVEALDAEGYQRNSGVSIDFPAFMKNLEHLYRVKGDCHIMIKITDAGLGHHKESDFYQMFGGICDEMSVEHITPVWPGFELEPPEEGFSQGIYGNEKRAVDVCPYIFYSICVNSDGSVSTCFMDWNHQNILGNIRENSLPELWDGAQMKKLRREHLSGKRSENKLCACCGQLTYATLDNLDPYREELLGRM